MSTMTKPAMYRGGPADETLADAAWRNVREDRKAFCDTLHVLSNLPLNEDIARAIAGVRLRLRALHELIDGT